VHGCSGPKRRYGSQAALTSACRVAARSARETWHAPCGRIAAGFRKADRRRSRGKRANLDCIGGKPENGDIYDVELLPDRGADGLFGGVANDAGAELRDALPPKDELTPVVLGAGQLVRIQAIGRAGHDPAYFYVATVPVSDVAACRGNRLCSLYGDRQSRGWTLHATECHIASDGRPTDACPQGWAASEDIEDFSNGM
jgi:hypothetical protein